VWSKLWINRKSKEIYWQVDICATRMGELWPKIVRNSLRCGRIKIPSLFNDSVMGCNG
jgi:hypothetical protein